MTKVQIKSERIATFGGFFHVIDLFRSLELDKPIDTELKPREKSWNTYSYSSILFVCLLRNDLLHKDGIQAPDSRIIR